MKTTLTTAALTSALVLLGAAHAQAPAPVEGPITKEDMLADATMHFEKADINGDGVLSEGEMATAAAEKHPEGAPRRGRGNAKQAASAMFARQDSNNDGAISLEESLAHAEARFDRVDADGDGVLTEEERAAARADGRAAARKAAEKRRGQ